jgi:hypothetical protein
LDVSGKADVKDRSESSIFPKAAIKKASLGTGRQLTIASPREKSISAKILFLKPLPDKVMVMALNVGA